MVALGLMLLPASVLPAILIIDSFDMRTRPFFVMKIATQQQSDRRAGMLYLQRQRASIQTVALVMLCGSVVVLLAFAWAPDRTFLCRAEGGCDVASPPSVLLSVFSFFADKRAEQKPSHTAHIEALSTSGMMQQIRKMLARATNTPLPAKTSPGEEDEEESRVTPPHLPEPPAQPDLPLRHAATTAATVAVAQTASMKMPSDAHALARPTVQVKRSPADTAMGAEHLDQRQATSSKKSPPDARPLNRLDKRVEKSPTNSPMGAERLHERSVDKKIREWEYHAMLRIKKIAEKAQMAARKHSTLMRDVQVEEANAEQFDNEERLVAKESADEQLEMQLQEEAEQLQQEKADAHLSHLQTASAQKVSASGETTSGAGSPGRGRGKGTSALGVDNVAMAGRVQKDFDQEFRRAVAAQRATEERRIHKLALVQARLEQEERHADTMVDELKQAEMRSGLAEEHQLAKMTISGHLPSHDHDPRSKATPWQGQRASSSSSAAQPAVAKAHGGGGQRRIQWPTRTSRVDAPEGLPGAGFRQGAGSSTGAAASMRWARRLWTAALEQRNHAAALARTSGANASSVSTMPSSLSMARDVRFPKGLLGWSSTGKLVYAPQSLSPDQGHAGHVSTTAAALSHALKRRKERVELRLQVFFSLFDAFAHARDCKLTRTGRCGVLQAKAIAHDMVQGILHGGQGGNEALEADLGRAEAVATFKNGKWVLRPFTSGEAAGHGRDKAESIRSQVPGKLRQHGSTGVHDSPATPPIATQRTSIPPPPEGGPHQLASSEAQSRNQLSKIRPKADEEHYWAKERARFAEQLKAEFTRSTP